MTDLVVQPAATSAARSAAFGVTAPLVLTALLVLAIIVGVATRFVGLRTNLYWRDEVATSLRLAGLTTHEVSDILNSQNRELRPAEINALVFPARPAPLGDVLTAVLEEEPHRPPLYYVLTFLHASIFGTSVLSLRLLSVVCGLLVLPAGYWLCRELFADRAVGVVGVALLATSPFHVQYGQEAREYGLWTALILASSAALLMGLRQRTPRSWMLYALLGSVALATSTLQLLVIGSHALFLVWYWRRRGPDASRWWPLPGYLIAFGCSVLFAGLTLSPWWWSGLEHRASVREATGWMSASVPWSIMLREWVKTFSRPFVAFAGEEWLYPVIPRIVGYALSVAALLIVAWSLVTLWLRRRSDRSEAAPFVSLLILVCLLAMVAPDLLFGGIRSYIGRYMAPVWLGFELAVAALMVAGCRTPTGAGRLWTIGLAGLLSVSVASSAVLAGHPGWGKQFLQTQGDDGMLAAREIAASPRPYVVVERLERSQTRPGEALALSIILEDPARFVISDDPTVALALSRQGDVFLIDPSDEFRSALSPVADLEAIRPPGQLLRLRGR